MQMAVIIFKSGEPRKERDADVAKAFASIKSCRSGWFWVGRELFIMEGCRCDDFPSFMGEVVARLGVKSSAGEKITASEDVYNQERPVLSEDGKEVGSARPYEIIYTGVVA